MNMSTNTIDLILPRLTEDIDSAELSQLPIALSMARRYACGLSAMSYIVDLRTGAPVFVSGNWSKMFKELEGKNVELSFPQFLTDSLEGVKQNYAKICRACNAFFTNIPVYEHMEHTISFSLDLGIERNRTTVYHRVIPLLQSKSGHVWLYLCLAKLASKNAPRILRIEKNGSKNFYLFDFQKSEWKENRIEELDRRDFECLKMAAQGFSIEDIAMKLCVSSDTIKAMRRRLFLRWGVDNIQEAISYAVCHKINLRPNL